MYRVRGSTECPFFATKEKCFVICGCIKYRLPYIGMVEGKKFDHPGLIIEKRSRMKIMLFDPNKDLPVKTIKAILQQAIDLYKTGTIKLKG